MTPRGLLLGAIVAAALAGCGGDDDTSPSAAPPGQTTDGPATTAAAPADTTTVELDEFEFRPSELTVREGAVLRADNVGAVPHNLTIEESESPEQLAATETFPGDEQRELEVDVAPGRYTLVCTVPGHREAGMVGSITVR